MTGSSSLVSQSVLMALTATVNKFTSSNVHALPRPQHKKDTSSSSSSSSSSSRRSVLLSAIIGAYPIATDSGTELLNKYLKKSEENKAKNDKERLDSYYKRNYKDYFDYVEGSVRGKKEEELSDSEKRILEWLKSNK
ncbi:unnamed protein product [Linum tenue]|uniref:Uncharacterized protein n=1 Tax=Linum tenue TaxID=586396 RepID=A0AAV0HKU4_9ROSI|nr:unnamed protein product [Linum tenue]